MSRKVQLRLVKTLIILALAFGVLDLRSAEAWPGNCGLYIGCEFCACLEDGCRMGIEFPECGGNASCCSSKVSPCWPGCIWY